MGNNSNGASRSATETLVKCMEAFGEAEPKNAIVIWTDEAGDINWSSTSDSVSEKVGLLEFVKNAMLYRSLREDQ